MSEDEGVVKRMMAPINSHLPDGVKMGLGTVYLYRTHESGRLEELAQSRPVRLFARASVPLFVLIMLGSLALFVHEALDVFLTDPQPTAANNPVNMVAIPGVNDLLPLAAIEYIIVSLLVAAAIHEGSHGIVMMAEGVDLKEYGVGLLLFIPIAAYVLPDEDGFENASTLSRVRVYAAGVVSNVAVSFVALAWFFLPWTVGSAEVFAVYFGPLFGGQIPTASVIAAIGPVGNFLFWSWFFHINLGLLNALPIAILDGGRIVSDVSDNFVGPVAGYGGGSVVLAISSVLTTVVFTYAVFGPYL